MPTLDDGRAAVAEGNLQQARLIFEAILQETPRSAEAWLGLADVLTETEDKRICYENVLKIDSSNRAAREGLRSLEPQANPLVAALSQQTDVAEAEEEDDFYLDEEDEPTLISAQPPPDLVDASEADSSGGGPSTAVLVAIGLALSIVVFAVGGGLVFFLISSFAGG